MGRSFAILVLLITSVRAFAVSPQQDQTDDLRQARAILVEYSQNFHISYRNLVTQAELQHKSTLELTPIQKRILSNAVFAFRERKPTWEQMPFYKRLAYLAILSEGFPRETYSENVLNRMDSVLGKEIHSWNRQMLKNFDSIKRAREKQRLSTQTKEDAVYHWLAALIVHENFEFYNDKTGDDGGIVGMAPTSAQIGDIYGLPPAIRTLVFIHVVHSTLFARSIELQRGDRATWISGPRRFLETSEQNTFNMVRWVGQRALIQQNESSDEFIKILFKKTCPGGLLDSGNDASTP